MNKITKNDPQAQTQDIVNENISKLRELFPEVFTEKKIDFETLESLLGDYIEKDDERYNFTWKGKAEARRIAQTPSTATLRPAKEESKNWDSTENLYIEGDNLEVLKLLQKSYHKKVKMIYIDPPYNTGKDFVYKDNYKDNLKNYMELTGQVDEEGNKISTNSDSSGRYHSNWLNMMYPRLKLARNLLKDDGVIFISIDDNEVHNLRKVCDEVFGEENFIADINVVNNLKGRNDKKYIATANERLLFYVKTYEFEESGFEMTDKMMNEYNLTDKEGKYRYLGLRKRGGADTRIMRPNMYFPIYVDPTTNKVSLESKDNYTIEVLPKKSDGTDGCWRWGKDTVRLRINNLVGITLKNNSDEYRINEKDYLKSDGEIKRFKPKSVLSGANYSTDGATKLFRTLLPEAEFNNPKSVFLLQDLVQYSTLKKNCIVLDFFSGSATTAHAVMQLNAEDQGNRKFIMVQLPEPTDEKSEAYKAGYKNICEIGKERIRRAGDKIIKELKEKQDSDQQKLLGEKKSVNTDDLDIGFKVFKLDSSNIKTWDATADNIEQKLLDSVHNIKSERSEDDVLFEILLKYGLDLTLPIEEIQVNGKKIYSVGYGSLVVCLDDEIDMEVAKRIVAIKDDKKPETMNVIFKDTGFKDDVAKTNVVQYLEKYEVNSIRSI